MEPSCSGLSYSVESKDECMTAFQMKSSEGDSDVLNIDQLERQDLEEENRLLRQCSGVIVDARRLALSSHFPPPISNVLATSLPSSSQISSSLISNSEQNSSDRSDPIPSASCGTTDEVSTPDNCCQNTNPVFTPVFNVNVTPPRPTRPYFIPKFKLYEPENSSLNQDIKEIEESDSNETSPTSPVNTSKDPETEVEKEEACNNSACIGIAEKPPQLPDTKIDEGSSKPANNITEVSIPHPAILFSDYEDADSVEGEDEDIICTCVSNCESEEDESDDEKPSTEEATMVASDGEGPEEGRVLRKRKPSSPSTSGASKKQCNCSMEDQVMEYPPDIRNWLGRFNTWASKEKLKAIDMLIKRCSADQVRHMMQSIEPLFQRDFISLLPRELALTVLGFLEPDDLLRASQTCTYWRFLADDNLLWKEKCNRIGITRIKKRTRLMPPTNSPWKSTYMRQRITEVNWKSRTVTPEKILKGHDDHVITCLQFYGNKVLSGSDDTTLKVWNALNGRCLKTLVGHTGGVWSSQMVGRVVISGSTDRTLRVWNAMTGACQRILTGHTSTVRCMHLHNDRVVSGSRDATLRVWNVTDGRCLRVLVGHMAAVRCVQYDGRLVVSGAYDYFVKVWNPDTGECLHTLAGHTNRVYSLQFDGVHVVSGSLDTSIMVWDVETGAKKHTLMGHQSLTSGMELRSNILVSGNADSTVKIWDIITGQCLHTLSGPNKHQSAVTCLQSNNRFVITSSDDGTVKLWDIRTGEFIRNLVTLESGGSGGVVWRIRASRTKLVCAVGSRNGTEETKLMVLDFDVPGACQRCEDFQ